MGDPLRDGLKEFSKVNPLARLGQLGETIGTKTQDLISEGKAKLRQYGIGAPKRRTADIKLPPISRRSAGGKR